MPNASRPPPPPPKAGWGGDAPTAAADDAGDLDVSRNMELLAQLGLLGRSNKKGARDRAPLERL